jgi:hypothetical protein
MEFCSFELSLSQINDLIEVNSLNSVESIHFFDRTGGIDSSLYSEGIMFELELIPQLSILMALDMQE